MPEAGLLGYIGHPPNVLVTERTKEQAKYETMWKKEEYRLIAPGEDSVPHFLEVAKPKPGSTVIDFGAGTGRGALGLAFFGGLKVKMLDFASNCLDEDVVKALKTQAHALSFSQHDLNKPVPFQAEYGYCTDVMEHIPDEEVNRVITNILAAAQHVFFQIDGREDSCGKMIGEKLHLSVHSYDWWLSKFQSNGFHVLWSKEFSGFYQFYISGWTGGRQIVAHGVLNAPAETLLDNIRKNLEGDWQEISPHKPNELEVLLLGGGPSLDTQLEKIKELRANGCKIVTVNNAYHWAQKNDLLPVNQVMVDSREFNQRFTHPVYPGCKYLISSQCHPSVLEGLPKDQTWLWHTTNKDAIPIISEKRKIWYAVPGGSTVVLRAIPLLKFLGFRKFHIFGVDSCLMDNKHHAYSQPENDNSPVMPVSLGGRIFRCHPWMAAQAQEFMDLIRFQGHDMEICVYGDGLLAHILNTGESLADEAVAEANALLA